MVTNIPPLPTISHIYLVATHSYFTKIIVNFHWVHWNDYIITMAIQYVSFYESYLLSHRHNLGVGGCIAGQMPPPVFSYLRNFFFPLSWSGAIKKIKIFSKWLFGHCKNTEKNVAPAFYRMQHRDISVPNTPGQFCTFPPHPKCYNPSYACLESHYSCQ